MTDKRHKQMVGNSDQKRYRLVFHKYPHRISAQA